MNVPENKSSMLESRLIPLYLNQSDRVWIEAVIDIYRQSIGRTVREVRAALAQADFYTKDLQKFKFVDLLLQDLFIKQDPSLTKISPLIRSELFLASANKDRGSDNSRATFIKAVCEKLSLSTADVEDLMFADIKSARILRQPETSLDPEEIRLKANLKLVQTLLLNAEKIVISMRGMCRPLMQCARWLGLISSIAKHRTNGLFTMEISGPLTILISTKIYGHALGRLVPFLLLAEQFTFEAIIWQNHVRKVLLIRQGDPIFPKEGLKKFDSLLESKFYDSFLKATQDWYLTREPEPLIAGSGLVFPDFAIRHKVRKDISWYLEIVGFWTKAYLNEKIKKYSDVPYARLILCINAKYYGDFDELPPNAKIVWYKTSIKPGAVLEILDGKL